MNNRTVIAWKDNDIPCRGTDVILGCCDGRWSYWHCMDFALQQLRKAIKNGHDFNGVSIGRISMEHDNKAEQCYMKVIHIGDNNGLA